MDIRNFFGSNCNELKSPIIEEGIKSNAEISANVPIKLSDVSPKDVENFDSSSVAVSDQQIAIPIDISQKIVIPIDISQQVTIPVAANQQLTIPDDLADFVNWLPGEAVPYLALVEIFEEISKVSSRIEKENLFAKLFRSVIYTTPNDLDVIMYLGKYFKMYIFKCNY